MEDLDYKVLEYIAKHGPVSVAQVEKGIPETTSIRDRMGSMLGYSGAIMEVLISYQDGALTKNMRTHQYVVTARGKRMLQDYKHSTRKHRRELWLKNAWIPILVSIVTNLVIAALKQLWPLIQQWASSFLSKTP